MHPRWERILRGESAYARFQRMYRTAFALVPSPWRCKFYNAPFKGPVAGTLKWRSGAHPPARARSASLLRFGGSATEISAQQPTTAAWSNLSKLVSMATRSLFLDDHGALFGLCDRVGCGLGLLPAGVVFGLAFAVVDVPHAVFLIDPDR